MRLRKSFLEKGPVTKFSENTGNKFQFSERPKLSFPFLLVSTILMPIKKFFQKSMGSFEIIDLFIVKKLWTHGQGVRHKCQAVDTLRHFRHSASKSKSCDALKQSLGVYSTLQILKRKPNNCSWRYKKGHYIMYSLQLRYNWDGSTVPVPCLEHAVRDPC